ncbi:substrate-binding periplasmic protein [Curvivirga aplysinae]|uniref:substrate-binding periplasmic protein n=1 Tax=Curvivirga aplysinae TaxID=2529852 RepID=UPI0012BD5C43|nr:transporter substrate-binding domain-containing protein [Curvivirga aplysinae]MTI09170.1 transporter substrate-binding domain-containing protein [Curvivirga aplysinae]
MFISAGIYAALSLPVHAAETLTLVVPEFPPYQYLENGEKKGFKLDLLQEASARAGYDLKIEFRPWARVLKMVENGDADFTNMYKNPEREKIYTFSQKPIFPITVRFFKHIDSAISYDGDFNKISLLKIGVVNKISYGKKFDKALVAGIFKDIERANNHNNLVSLLAGKRVDLIVGASYVIDSVIEKNGLTSTIEAVTPNLSNANVYNTFTKKRDMRQVSDAIDTALQEMREDGTFGTIIYDAFSPKIN